MELGPEHSRFEFGFACDVGRKRRREPNQDTVEVVLPGPGQPGHPPLLLVADGLGRHFGGALASQVVVRTFKHEFQRAQHPAKYSSLLDACAQAAHREIRAQGQSDPKLASMGTTLVAVALTAERFFLLNLGDSRAYLVRDQKTRQISRDQSWVAAQVRAGVLTEQEARTHPNRNRLIMALTAKRNEIKPYTTEDSIEPQDILVLCSDGLWGVVPESLIQATATELVPQAAADKLVALANSSRGPDNISVVIARRVDVHGTFAMQKLEDTKL
jgi:PPM family protein phosphatase